MSQWDAGIGVIIAAMLINRKEIFSKVLKTNLFFHTLFICNNMYYHINEKSSIVAVRTLEQTLDSKSQNAAQHAH